jgi:hypothetical protein
MKPFLVPMMVGFTILGNPARADDLNDYIVERAARCWTGPVALRDAQVEFTFDVRFRRDGHVDLVQIVQIVPDSQSTSVLAREMAAALQRCGPYVTEGMLNLTLTISAPM